MAKSASRRTTLRCEPCIISRCSNPPFGVLVTLFQQLRKEPIQGYGKLIKVDVTAWKGSKEEM
jgi:hypothetical protein